MKNNNLLTLVLGFFLILGCTVKEKAHMTKPFKVMPNDQAYKFVKSSGGIEEYKLKHNGLTVLLMEDHSAPVATFMVTYNVGSRNEAIGYTGSTHILEHLMFKGSKNFNKEQGNPIWTVLQDVGAQINATTWMDRTNYFELLPSEHLEKAIAIEADRMRNAFLRDEDRQPEMTVVRNEFERGENSPYQALDKLMWSTAIQAHPYHHSTIGWRSDIENVSTERLQEFYNTFYYPNNATATLIGDFNKEQALTMIQKYFGIHSSSPHEIPTMYTTEPKQEGQRRAIVRRSGQAGIVGVAYKMPYGLHEDIYPLQVLGNVLYGGKSSRLYRKIVDQGLATGINIDNFPFHDDALFITYVFLTPGTDHEKIEKIIVDEFNLIKKDGISDKELKKALAQIRADEAFSRDGSYSIASSLNESIAMGDWTYYTTYLEKVKSVTTNDVQRVVQTYMVDDQSTIGYFVPEDNNTAGGGAEETQPPRAHSPYFWRPNNFSEGTDQSPTLKSSRPNIATQISDQTVLEGIRILTLNNGVKDVVTIRGSFLGGDVYSPKSNPMVAELTAAMLDQGTIQKDKFTISEELESVGADISFSSASYRVRFNAQCLKDDVDLVLSLIGEQLRTPKFSEKDFETVKSRNIGNLKRAKESTRGEASRAFSHLLYPAEHPNYRLSIDEAIDAVNKLSIEDIKSYHEKNYGLGDIIVTAVGDVNADSFKASVENAFEGWKISPLKMLDKQSQANPKKKVEKYVTIEDKTSVDTYMGQAIGIDRTHADYYPLMMGMYILGGNFSARLMQTVRDQQGLTYGTYATISGMDNSNDGNWYAWGTFSPDLLNQGKEAIIDQIKILLENGITQNELDAKKTTITGTYKVGLATTGGMAAQILINAERGRSNEYLDQYPDKINELTLSQVNEVIIKYIDPNNLIVVSAGSIDEEGNLIESD